jgi:tetratricopeptide (TPR) repeat protein
MAVQQLHDSPEDASDLAQMWNEALEDFKGKTKLDLTKFQFNSMEEAIASTKQQQDGFATFRHDKGKVDAVRSAFGNNLRTIERIVSTTKMAADAASVFPPAIPGAALMTAFTYVFKTFKDVKADYDRVAGFFNEMSSFLDRISMLESKSPKLEPLQRCVRKVFANMLMLCGIAADYKGKGRFRKWLKNAVDGGGDPALAGAYAGMDDAISKLGGAVGIATLRTTMEIKETTTTINSKTDTLLSETRVLNIKADQTARNTSAIREGVETLDIRMEGVQTSITTVDTTVRRIDDKIETHQAILISKLDALLMQSSGAKKTSDKKDARKGDTAGKKHRALARVKRHFADSAVVRKKISAQRVDIEDDFVKDIGSWIFEDERYKSWVEGSQPTLWLSGSAGVGKTYLALAIASDLEKHRQSDKTSVAYFFFRETSADQRSFRSALRCSVLQIAEKNAGYCETIAAEISHDADEEPWKQFFADRFPAKSDTHLYLILDGVDEALDVDKAVITEVLKEITKDQLNVHVLFTSRPTLQSTFAEFVPHSIEMTRELIVSDMKKLVEVRIRTLPRVRKFQRQTRKRIEDKILQKADSMLYIEHVLRRISAIGRESSVIRDLKKEMPDSLEDLYKLLLAECQSGRTLKQYETLRTLFAMLAFSKRALTLDEAADLIKLTDPDGVFDIEDEVIGRSARILELNRNRNEEDAVEEEEHISMDVEDSTVEEAFLAENGKTPLSFQERSLREYFRSISVEENGLRTPPSTGHLTILELLVTLLCDNPPITEGGKDAKLRDYAAHFWAQHFCEIDADSISEDQFSRALNSVYRILTNDGNVAKAIETYHPPNYQELDKEVALIDKLSVWFTKKQMNSISDTRIKSWVAEAVTEPQKVILALARGHVENWFETDEKASALSCFSYSKSALLLSGANIQKESTTTEDIFQVVEFFSDIQSTSKTYRSIGNVMQSRSKHKETIEYCMKGLELEQLDLTAHFRLLSIIAWSHYEIGYDLNEIEANKPTSTDKSGDEPKIQANTRGQEDRGMGETNNVNPIKEDSPDGQQQCSEHQEEGEKEAEDGIGNSKLGSEHLVGLGDSNCLEALETIGKALAILPEDFQKSKKLAECAEGILMLRAVCEKELRRWDDALKSYKEHRAIRPDVDTMNATALYNEAVTEYWRENPEGFVDLVDSWTEAERTRWLNGIMFSDDDWSEWTSEALHEQAAKAGQRGKDRAIVWLTKYISNFKKDSTNVVRPMAMLAWFYNIVIGDHDKAIQIYEDILGIEFKDAESENLEEDLSDCRLELANLIFQSFRARSDPKEKLALQEKIRKLPNLRTGGTHDEKGRWGDWQESLIKLMLALMTRTIGSPIEYQQILDSVFKTSIECLSDSLGWNDASSFRILARVLACIPGLEHDAQIALSCQYSITDTSVDHGESSDDSDTSSETGDNATKEEEATSDGTTKTELHPGLEVTQTAVNTTVQEASVSEVTVDVAVEIAKLTVSDPEDEVEDLLPESDRYYWCDGPCGKLLMSWNDARVIYICVQCPFTDLEEDCYQVMPPFHTLVLLPRRN